MEQALGKSDGSSLMQHIEDCLGVYSQLRETLPLLPSVAQLSNFWDLLFYVIYFHDWGKCHKEFQKVLRGIQSNYWNNQRHEIYSIPFVAKLELSDSETILIQRAILGHHKPFAELLEKLKSKNDLNLEYELKWKRDSHYQKDFHPEDFTENLRHNFNFDYLKYLSERFDDIGQKYSHVFQSKLSKSIDLRNQKHPVETIAKPAHKTIFLPDQPTYWQNLLLWGAAKICDHYGSAHIETIFKFSKNDFAFLDRLKENLKTNGQDFYSHQKACFDVIGNCILIAPTGSGKTEAAIGWLERQLSQAQGRAFYILPYTASINAMHQRLIKDFSKANGIKGENLIGIQHGKLTQYLASLYDEIDDSTSSTKSKDEPIKCLRDQYKKMIHPLKIVTPFQILKYCYGVKGFEMGLAELVGAKLIFDEIHAYDEITFAQIVTSLQYLVKHLHCNVMVMTATLPSFMLRELQKTLDVQNPIKADSQLLNSFDRHRVKIKEGTIFDNIEAIKKFYYQNKRIIAVCNTVQNAQQIYELLKDEISVPADEITLLHSRFNYIDRHRKEKQALDDQNKILIGTQAIEVSLDIDYDVMFTEPAPLDALLQRFGRVNRKRKKEISPIFVCKMGGEHDHFIYPVDIVERTLELLSQLDVIHEGHLQRYLDFVYPDWKQEQFGKYHDTRISFEQAIRSLQPYARHKENEAEFYEKFDGIQALPVQYLDDYKRLIENFDFINAERLLVTIHRGMYFKLKNNGQIENYVFAIERAERKIFKKYITIAKCKYDSEIGMTDEFYEIQDYSTIL